MMLGPGIEPGTHWWEASALTTVPSLLPLKHQRTVMLLPPLISSSMTVEYQW